MSIAIIAPKIGGQSETFILRHIKELSPENTVVVAKMEMPMMDEQWEIKVPTLILNKHVPDALSFANTQIRRLARMDVENPFYHNRYSRIKKFLKKHNVKVILGEYLDYSYSYIKLSRELKIPFFAHAHGYDISMRLFEPAWRERYKQYNDTDGIITMSQNSKSRLVDLGIHENKIFVIPYGVDVPSICYEHPEKKPIHCLAVGRMVGKKAPLILLHAFRQAMVSCDNLYLDYIGDGELFNDARKYVIDNNMQDKVTLHGGKAHNNVLEMMKQSDIFIQHSITDPETGDEEGLPVAILEAMANALPVVSTLHAGIPEAVVDGETGFLVEEGDSEAMGEKIAELSASYNLRKSCGMKGWQRAKDYFSIKGEMNSLINLLCL